MKKLFAERARRNVYKIVKSCFLLGLVVEITRFL
jgi:hypothetical protein